MNKNVKILVCCHKKDLMVVQEPYLPIQVGKSNAIIDLGIQGDDTGDNISHLNHSYAELTGLYWAWKNLKCVDYIGLCHYRRYFDFHRRINWGIPYKAFHVNDFYNFNFEITKDVEELLDDGLIIAPRKHRFPMTVADDYALGHIKEDVEALKLSVEMVSSPKYYQAFEKIYFNSNYFYPFNMFIMSWSTFNKYCNWIFNVFQNYAKLILDNNHKDYQSRVVGFTGERLLTVFVEAERIRVKEFPIAIFDNSLCDKNKSSFSWILHRLRCNIAFKIIHFK